MSLTDLVIPPWVRFAALAGVIGVIFGAGFCAGSRLQSLMDTRAIETARRETADLRASVAQAASKQAEQSVQIAAKQIQTNQEVIHESTNRARALDQRIAGGGLRLSASSGGSACRLPASPSNPGQSADFAAQSLPAGSGRDSGPMEVGVGQALQDAARDAQQLAELIDAAYRVGCAGQ